MNNLRKVKIMYGFAYGFADGSIINVNQAVLDRLQNKCEVNPCLIFLQRVPDRVQNELLHVCSLLRK